MLQLTYVTHPLSFAAHPTVTNLHGLTDIIWLIGSWAVAKPTIYFSGTSVESQASVDEKYTNANS